MSSFLAMFPGQGSQFPEMSKNLIKEFPEVIPLFEEAEDRSKMPLRRVCTSFDEYEKLQQTIYQQPSILTHSYAVWTVIQERLDLEPSFFAGHSLGEYTALVASQKLDFGEAISLVCERACAMQESIRPGVGGMLAVKTKDSQLLEKLCFETKESYGGVLEIVNFNSPEQYILSGHLDLLKIFFEVLRENKILGKLLDVSGPFHSSLMKEARLRMTPILEKTKLSKNDNYVISNVSGKVAHPYTCQSLISQIDHPVLWLDSLRCAFSQGVDTFVEFGPQQVLSSLVVKSLPKGPKIFNTSSLRVSLGELENELLRIKTEDALSQRQRVGHFSKEVADAG